MHLIPNFYYLDEFELLWEGYESERWLLMKWLTTEIDEIIKFIKKYKLIKPGESVHATGGGAHKYFDLFKEELGAEIIKVDELKSLVKGMIFLQDKVKESWFTFTESDGRIFQEEEIGSFPRILVSIGSGVSIIKVNSYIDFQRVSGTMIGGGTLIGLSNLLTNINDFDLIQEQSK